MYIRWQDIFYWTHTMSVTTTCLMWGGRKRKKSLSVPGVSISLGSEKDNSSGVIYILTSPKQIIHLRWLENEFCQKKKSDLQNKSWNDDSSQIYKSIYININFFYLLLLYFVKQKIIRIIADHVLPIYLYHMSIAAFSWRECFNKIVVMILTKKVLLFDFYIAVFFSVGHPEVIIILIKIFQLLTSLTKPDIKFTSINPLERTVNL